MAGSRLLLVLLFLLFFLLFHYYPLFPCISVVEGEEEEEKEEEEELTLSFLLPLPLLQKAGLPTPPADDGQKSKIQLQFTFSWIRCTFFVECCAKSRILKGNWTHDKLLFALLTTSEYNRLSISSSSSSPFFFFFFLDVEENKMMAIMKRVVDNNAAGDNSKSAVAW
jgi:hypothetical protein